MARAGDQFLLLSGTPRSFWRGTITTVAGNGTPGSGGDGGPATSAQLSSLISVAVDSAGNLLIGDSGNYRIRKVTWAQPRETYFPRVTVGGGKLLAGPLTPRGLTVKHIVPGVDVWVKNDDLAALVDVTRYERSRLLRQSEEECLIEKYRDGVLIRRPEKLISAYGQGSNKAIAQ